MSVSQSEFTNKYSIIRSITDDDFYDKNVYLLGSAERGKINEPVLIKNMVQFINLLTSLKMLRARNSQPSISSIILTRSSVRYTRYNTIGALYF
jgi:hypothetical protein